MSPAEPSRAETVMRLEFGCGSLGSDLSYRASCALVEGAYDYGFRHFDVAPPYGNGLAERILGDVLGPVRDSVTIVTKAGIAHPRAGAGFRLVRRLFLPVKATFPGLWNRASGRANHVVAPQGRFKPDELTTSVQESLRRLRTDRVDVLLLHEIQPQDINEELLRAIESIQSRGWVGAVGIGTTVPNSVRIVEQHPRTFAWVQANHYWAAFLPQLRTGAHRLVTHGCLRSGRRVVASQAFQQKSALGDASLELREALADPQRGPELLLAAALTQNENGLVVVSTSKLERVNRFATLARKREPVALVQQLNGHLAAMVPPTSAEDA